MEGLAEHLLAPSPSRNQGTHDAQGVLIRANAGTGKTVSLQQLTRLLAKRLLSDATTVSSASAQSRPKASSVGPNVQSGAGIGLVPIFVSVQRLASYMKKQGGTGMDKADLLRAYIDTEYTGAERDLLAQAYQLRALVCSIDGVDEAAGLKSRIEELVVEQLIPKGVRTVVSSRPEGVRLERYKDWVVMNLSPLSDEQQHTAISVQLQNSKYFEHLSALAKLRRQGVDVAAAGSTHYEAVVGHIKGSSPDTDVDVMLEKILKLFETASRVPVMLSMLVLCLEVLTDATPLPASRLDLYKSAVQASIIRNTADAAEADAVATMLAKVAVVNHTAQRREFTSVDVASALTNAEELNLWKKMDGKADGIPLIKTLEVGEHATSTGGGAAVETASKYQFTHLSFQEAYFAQALCSSNPAELVGTDLAATISTVWERGSLKLLNDRWLLNTFNICGGLLGPIVGEHLSNGMTELKLTEHQIKAMAALEWAPIRGHGALSRVVCCCGEGGELASKYSPGAAHLGAILSERSEAPGLTAIDFGTPAKIAKEAAVVLASSCIERRGLRLYGQVNASQFGSLGDADAVLIAASLRNCVSPAADAIDVSIARIDSDQQGYCIVLGNLQTTTLADALTEKGVQVGSFPKELGPYLLLAGFSAEHLRSGLRMGTAELADTGFPAADIAVSTGNAANSPQALKELADANLALELIVTSGGKITHQDLLNAGCSNVPTGEVIDEAMKKAGLDATTISSASGMVLSSKDLSDGEGAALMWAVAMHGSKKVEEVILDRNRLGAQCTSVLAQVLRYSTKIKSLDLHNNSLGDSEATVLAKALTANQSLKSLRVSGNRLTAAGAATLFDAISNNHYLEQMTFDSGTGTLEEGIQVPPLKGMVPAEVVDMGSRHFGPLSAIVVCKLIERYRPPVTKLVLDKNPILPEGGAAVASMVKANDDIKILEAKFCSLGPEGIGFITDALKVNSSLEHVSVLANNLGPDGAKAIMALLQHMSSLANMSLKSIDVQDNLFPPESRKEIREYGDKIGLKMVV